MMDDGMLLNFSIDDGIIKPEQKFRGGTWRDRLSAKKIAQWRSRTQNGDTDQSNPNRIQLSVSRPHKRQKTDGEFKPQVTGGGATTHSRDHDAPVQQLSHSQHRQVISSLFSFNPTPKNADGQTAMDSRPSSEPVKPSNAPLIDESNGFTALGLSSPLATHLLTKMKLKAPTAVQKSSIPQLLKEDCDAFIQAETGSGKTLAYLLPVVQKIMALSMLKVGNDSDDMPSTGETEHAESTVHRDTGLFAIVMAPTRELCKQISVVLENLLHCAHWIVAGTVIGGEKKKSEKARLRKGLNILVATPGRLADHLDNTKVLDVSNVRWLVLDEGDRLMDLGFEEEIQAIVKKLDERQRPSKLAGLPSKRMTILCSATLKMTVQKLGEISLKDAVHVKADPADEENGGNDTFSVPAQLKQSYVVAAAKLRLVTLTALMKRTFSRKGSVMKAIIFVSCADSVEFHFEVFTRKGDNESGEDKGRDLGRKGEKPECGTIALATAFSNPSNPVMIHKLHGSLPQHVRTSTLSAFARNHEASVLICTDVASRGLDLPNVNFVIEYDPACNSDDHLHRIGRTARLGRDGRALIFLLPGNEESYVEVLKGSYRDGGKSLTCTDANEILRRGFGGNTDAGGKNWEEKATEWQLEVERWTLKDSSHLELARRAFQSHVRAYATHVSSERSMFNIKELHLGHLAKSFALRDRPSKINVPGLRSTKEETKKEFKKERHALSGRKRKASSVTTGRNKVDDGGVANSESDAARKMWAKMKGLTGAGEFNLA
ncbi:P-loop containing nucleoside triphosphate hydrolase protein [Elaphomyces granulatus]